MKNILILLMIMSFQAFSYSINPDREHHPLFKVYSRAKIIGPNMKLPGLHFDGNSMKEGRKSVLIPTVVYNKVKMMADSTLTVSSSEAEGSAVHVGENLILTNLHVISSLNKKVPRKCRANFYSKAYFKSSTRFKCKKIHHCSKDLDYCLVEVFNSKRGQALDTTKSAKLNPVFSPINKDKVELFAVGNTNALGIYASSGYGYASYGAQNIKYYASSFSGNSGGGLFNDVGELVGIVRAQSKLLYGTRSFNVAIPLHIIKQDLSLKSKVSKDVINKLNWTTI